MIGTLAGCLEEPIESGSTTTRSFSRGYDVSGETTVSVDNGYGPVTVRGTDAARLAISGEIRAESRAGLEDVSVTVLEGERFVVATRFTGGSSVGARSVALTVEIPNDVTVDRVTTANGRVSVSEVRGDVRAITGDGDIELADISGHVSGDTATGDVRTRDTAGLLAARTSNGEVDVEVSSMRGDVTCRSGNGPVTVRVGPTVAAAVRLSTNRGTVEQRDLPFTPTMERRGYLVGQLRGGESPLLVAESSDGDVLLRPV